MRARGMTAVLAFVLAAAATVGVFLYVRGVKNNNNVGTGKMTTVVVSKRDIPAGTQLNSLISGGDFAPLQVPTSAVVPGAVTALSQLQGRTTSNFILQGEQISTARLQGSSAPTGGILGIPVGYQAVTIQLEPQRVVNDFVQPGDHVVVYATSTQSSGNASSSSTSSGSATSGTPNSGFFPGATLTLVPNVQVLRVVAPSTGTGLTVSTSGTTFVTLALKPRDAAAVVAAQAQGDVWLALLPPQGHGQPQGPVFIGG